MDIEKILTMRYGDLLLKGWHKILTDKTGTRFFACMVVDVTDKKFPGLFKNHLKNISYSVRAEDHVQNKFERIGNGARYSYKQIEKCFAEKLIAVASINITAIFFEDEWYMNTSIIYHDATHAYEAEFIKDIVIKPNAPYWKSHSFQPVPPLQETVDQELLKQQLGGSLDIGLLKSYLKKTPYTALPKKMTGQTRLREYVGQPGLVAQVKQQDKETRNRLFEASFNKSVFSPFVKSLKKRSPQKFHKTYQKVRPALNSVLLWSFFIMCLFDSSKQI